MHKSPRLITLKLDLRTRKREHWTLATETEIYAVTTSRRAARELFQTLRYVINRTLKLNSRDYMFLGNKRINGQWVTEWMQTNDSLFDLEIEAHSLNTHNQTSR